MLLFNLHVSYKMWLIFYHGRFYFISLNKNYSNEGASNSYIQLLTLFSVYCCYRQLFAVSLNKNIYFPYRYYTKLQTTANNC